MQREMMREAFTNGFEVRDSRSRAFGLAESLGNCAVSIQGQRIAFEDLPPKIECLLAVAAIIGNYGRSSQPRCLRT